MEMCILNLLVLVLILIDWSHYFWVGELCTISQGVSLHWLISALWSAAVALHDTTRFRTGFILSIHVAWGCAIRMWSDWSCAQKHSMLTLCWCVACGCGMSSLSAEAFRVRKWLSSSQSHSSVSIWHLCAWRMLFYRLCFALVCVMHFLYIAV